MQIQAEYHGLTAGVVGPIGLVTVTDSGCSPMRPRLNSFIGYNPVSTHKYINIIISVIDYLLKEHYTALRYFFFKLIVLAI